MDVAQALFLVKYVFARRKITDVFSNPGLQFRTCIFVGWDIYSSLEYDYFCLCNCRKLMEELISTEENYIRHMQLVVEVSSED